MIALYILLGVVFLILFVLFLNIHFIFEYNEEVSVIIRVLCFRFRAEKLFSAFSIRKEENEKEAEDKQKPKRAKRKRKGTPADFLDFVRLIARIARLALKELLEKMKIRVDSLYVRFGAEDAAATALLYAPIITAANGLFALLDRFTHFSYNNNKLHISPDYENAKTVFKLKITFTLKLVYFIKVYLNAVFRFHEGKDGKK